MVGSQQHDRLRIVIVGGVAGGASAAARARRANAAAEIVLLEKGPHVSFANCGLPYHIGGEIESRETLLVTSAELFRDRLGIDVRTHTEAVAIDRDQKVVRVRTPDGDVGEIAYDKLILSPGAEPIRPPFVDRQYRNVCTLWSLADMDRVLEEVRANSDARAVVIGGGFVGLEIAEQLTIRGHACTLIERNGQVLKTLDPEMALPLKEELESAGITVRLETTVTGLEHDDGVVSAVRIGDERLPADLVLLAIGVRPRVELAAAADLELGDSGAICVDGWMRTSDSEIFAVGDCVEYPHAILAGPAHVPLAGPANRAGRIAGATAAGLKVRPMAPVCGTSVVRVFKKTAASTGLTAAQCRSRGIECRSIYVQATHHASYFPGAEPLLLKLIYTPEGKLLGAQGIGTSGVDKRIDVIATVLHFGGSVHDLTEIDLAYAPPFGSAKDPVHMAGFVAANDLQGHPTARHPEACLDGFQVVDVRNQHELERIPLPGAVHLPIDELSSRLSELDPNQPTVTVCHTGKRGHIAACLLKNNGFEDVSNLTGGMLVRSRIHP